jgi:hypothetical protein
MDQEYGIVKPFNFRIKYWKDDSIVQRTMTALTRMQVLEQLSITESDVIECKVIDGV